MLSKFQGNTTSFPIHDPRLSLLGLCVVFEELSVSTRSGNSGHGGEDLYHCLKQIRLFGESCAMVIFMARKRGRLDF